MKNFVHGLNTKQLDILYNVLKPFADQIELVGLFGSRATGTYRPNSDIDLVIYGSINEKTTDHLFTLFNDSNLPFKVDIQNYNLIVNTSLKLHIDSKMLLLFTQEQLKTSIDYLF
jgi:predicted nucleotidyltransferase